MVQANPDNNTNINIADKENNSDSDSSHRSNDDRNLPNTADTPA